MVAVTGDTDLTLKNGMLTVDGGSVRVVKPGEGMTMIRTISPSPGHHAAFPVYNDEVQRPDLPFGKSVPYLSKKNAYPPANLNGVATFPTPAGAPEIDIECCHLAVQYLYDCLHDEAGKVDLNPFESVEQIAQHVPENGTDADYETMRRDAQEAHLIKTDHLDSLLMEQFKKIESDSPSGAGVRGLLVESSNHSMAIRLRVKPHPQDDNKKIYVVTFYDPNMTDATVRCEVDDLSKLNGQTLRQYIDGDGQHDSYYSSYFRNDEDCALVHVCSPQAAQQPPLQTSQGRALTSRCEGLSPAVMWHLLSGNFSVDLAGLSEDFAKLDVETQVRLLAAKDMNGTPGFYMALQEGHVEVIRAYGELLKQLPKEARTQALVKLLEAKAVNGTPGLFMALQEGRAEAICAYGELLKQLPEEARVQSLITLLEAKDANGTPGLLMALQNGHAEAIRPYGELLKQLPEEARTQSLITLLEAKAVNGTPGLFMALQNGHAKAIRAYGELLKQLPKEDQTKFLGTLLEAKASKGTPGLLRALLSGHAEAIRAYGELLKQLPEEVQTEFLATLLEAKNAQGIPGLFMALQKGHAEAIGAYGELLKQLTKEARDQFLVTLLEAKDLDGTPGLFMALQEGHAKAIRAYGELLKQLPEEARVQSLVTLLEAKDADGISGFSIALEEGHTEAVQAYEALREELTALKMLE
ncbi:ShET2/EspL2 family type III secretion system effector toxin [Dyella sp. M7H15-1]|uniref:ShET2/EspL2 family type III secretion system effector toxin n=1 Tax=Dyella sp. M7H15-1 TaxID=2501295 RepID=UPI0013E8EF76|nr:ShET2/EspL2 family type III secretion system effector toxin [Dyella sp. M7H15-1]